MGKTFNVAIVEISYLDSYGFSCSTDVSIQLCLDETKYLSSHLLVFSADVMHYHVHINPPPAYTDLGIIC